MRWRSSHISYLSLGVGACVARVLLDDHKAAIEAAPDAATKNTLTKVLCSALAAV